jgi:signal transduction histidine kinase
MPLRPPAGPAPWERLLLPLLLPLLLAWLLLPGGPAWGQGQTLSQELRQAWFSQADGGSVQALPLPDTWRQRDLPARGHAHYRLEFTLTQRPAPGQTWVLRAERLSRLHQLRLNGHLVHETPDTPAMRVHASPAQTWLELPAEALQLGSNRLDIQLYYHRRAGLSTIWVGPASELEAGYRWMRLKEATLPQWLNMLAAGFSLLLLLVWMDRRHERALGLFALLCLLTAVRNAVYGLSLPPALVQAFDLFFYAAQVLSLLLLAGFAMAWTEHWRPRLMRGLVSGAVLLLLAGALASWQHKLEIWRTWSYPLLMLVGLGSLALILRRAFQLGGWRRLGLALALLLLVCGGIFDYLVGQGFMDVTHRYVLPWLQPVAMIAFASLLAERLVQALRRSERHQAELEQLVAARTAELQAADLAKTRLLRAASHDLRQPVTALGLQLGMAKLRAQDPAQRQMLDRATQGLQSLEDMLKGLLDYSRVERDDAPVQQQTLPMQGLFEAIALHAEPLARARGLELRIRPCRLWVRSDPLLLEQVLRNLISNAIKHSTGRRVLLSLRPRGHQAWLEVRDGGPGIAPADQQRIFEPFVQLDRADTSHEQGSGLGLAIVRHALRRLGHRLELHSRLGRGSCFRLILPLCPTPSSWPWMSSESPKAAPPASLAGQRIDLVEDDGPLREALQLQLQHWGMEVRAFADAESLLRQLDQPALPPPHWVLADRGLPGLHGDVLLERLGQRWPNLRLALMSADIAPDEAAAEQRWPLLRKPFSPQALQDLLARPPRA